MANVTYSFSCGIRGYHEYKTRWVPVLHEVLPVKHESRNCHDRYAMAVMKRLPGTLVASVVGHLPREISRLTHFIIVHGAKVSCKVMDVHHRRSPLVQGGLEIPCKVIVEMEMTEKNALAIDKYKQLVSDQYQEPVEGKFPDATQQILDAMKSPSDEELNSSSGSNTSESEPE